VGGLRKEKIGEALDVVAIQFRGIDSRVPDKGIMKLSKDVTLVSP
jgi:hypothetical protein